MKEDNDIRRLEIVGDPGSGNTFGETVVQHADNVNVTRKGVVYASVITKIINKLAEVKVPIAFDDNINVDVIYIKNKVSFNDLRRWAEDVQYFTASSTEVDRIYQEFDMAGTSKTNRVLFTLNRAYRRLSDRYHGDELFDELLNYVMEVVGNDTSLMPGVYREDVEYNARIVLVDAFIRCEIFKKPEE